MTFSSFLTWSSSFSKIYSRGFLHTRFRSASQGIPPGSNEYDCEQEREREEARALALRSLMKHLEEQATHSEYYVHETSSSTARWSCPPLPFKTGCGGFQKGLVSSHDLSCPVVLLLYVASAPV